MTTWQQTATVLSVLVGTIASALGLATAAIISRLVRNYRTATSAAMQELAEAQLTALLDLRQAVEQSNLDATELSRIDVVLSAGDELARARTAAEISAQTDRLRDLAKNLQVAHDAAEGPGPKQARPGLT